MAAPYNRAHGMVWCACYKLDDLHGETAVAPLADTPVMWCSSGGRRILTELCLYATVLCAIIIVHNGTSSSYRSVDYIGLWSCLVLTLYLPSASVSSIFMALFKILCYIPYFTFWWAEPGGIWLTNYCPSVVWHCWLGRLTRKIVPQMTYKLCQVGH